MNKKYYWLKLKRDFFKRHDIQIIESMPNGKDYILFYLKLLCESIDHDGRLRFNDEIPYNEQMISIITNTNVDIVKNAINLFANLDMMDIMDDGTYYMSKVEEMIGSESSSKERVRSHRERKKLRENIELELVRKISHEMIALPDGGTKFIDNKRYGGNGEYVYELAMCKCEHCGETDSKSLVIHHHNGYSNDLEDLYLLCRKCHANVENGNITNLKHNRKSVTRNTYVTTSNIDIDIDKDIYVFKTKDKDYVVKESDLQRYKDVYPFVDVEQELKKMGLWLDSNVSKRKTHKGMPRFINNWLNNCKPKETPSYIDEIPEV